jgi:hypothetical protein
MKHVLTFLALMVFQYFLFAFIAWNINAEAWPVAARFVYATMCTALSISFVRLLKDFNDK